MTALAHPQATPTLTLFFDFTHSPLSFNDDIAAARRILDAARATGMAAEVAVLGHGGGEHYAEQLNALGYSARPVWRVRSRGEHKALVYQPPGLCPQDVLDTQDAQDAIRPGVEMPGMQQVAHS